VEGQLFELEQLQHQLPLLEQATAKLEDLVGSSASQLDFPQASSAESRQPDSELPSPESLSARLEAAVESASLVAAELQSIHRQHVTTGLMLQQEEAEDFVIATGEQHSVREFVDVAANEIDIKIRWEGKGVDEKGYDTVTGKCIVAVDPVYFRPAEVETLLGDPTKAKEKLGWTPTTTFYELVQEMMREDLKEAQRDELVKKHGFKYFNHHE
jgi:hypothetical protein